MTDTLSSTPYAALELARSFESRMARGIQLYAGSCLLSPRVHQALNNSMGLMPAMGEAHHKQQPGTGEISQLEELVNKQLTALFDSHWAEARLQSCTYANAAVYAAFSEPGELIATISSEHGGHISHHEQGTLGVLSRRQLPLLFSNGVYDDPASAELIRTHRPRIVMLGGSVTLAPYDTRETVLAAQETGALLVYDASHVAGLIAAGLYQNPMHLGFDIMTSSTYKTLSAPPGGLLLGRHDKHLRKLKQYLVGGWTSNYDASRLTGISVALDEAKLHMRQYMGDMLHHVNYLYEALRKLGVDVIGSLQTGHSRPSSHQLVIRTGSAEQATALSKRAERLGIYAGTARIPNQAQAGGWRLGAQVITRQGITEAGLDRLAWCLHGLINEAPEAEIAAEVQSLAAELNHCMYW